jgi:UDP-3-O-[3-hydroxymyristoyl] N-acetylglucosamine deacetylase
LNVQTTLRTPVSFSDTGLHSGRPVVLTLHPAKAGHGIVFRRTDLAGRNNLVPARWDHAVQTPLNTRIENADGAYVLTIEHLMAALAGCGLHNVLIDIDGPEVPILDGSAAEFVRGLLAAGQRQMPAGLQAIRILEPVQVEHGDALARLDPATTLQIDFSIDFPGTAIGHQQLSLNMANGAFVRELCNSRTFCRREDIEKMRANGLALGGTLHNAVVYDGDTVLTPGGLRQPDEAVRHKMLDALGDLYTAGAPIIGRYTGIRAGHALTNRLLRALFANPAAFRMVQCDRSVMARLPGSGVGPADLFAVA